MGGGTFLAPFHGRHLAVRPAQGPVEADMPARLIAFFSVLALVLFGGSSLGADVLEFHDGARVFGRLISVERGWVEFQPSDEEFGGQPLRVAVAEVRAIRFDDGDPARGLSPRQVGGGGDRVDPEVPRPRARDRRRRDRMITVPAERWTDTGIDVAAGDVVSFSVAGTVTLGDDRLLGPEGDLDDVVAAPRRPLPDRPAGALIGRIGTSPDDTFFIGAERLPFRVRTSGRLFLGVNDDELADDAGAFQVAVGR